MKSPALSTGWPARPCRRQGCQSSRTRAGEVASVTCCHGHSEPRVPWSQEPDPWLAPASRSPYLAGPPSATTSTPAGVCVQGAVKYATQCITFVQALRNWVGAFHVNRVTAVGSEEFGRGKDG